MKFTSPTRLHHAVLSGICLSLLVLSGCQPATPDTHLSAAQVYMQDGDNKAAIVELKNAIQLDPEYAEARFALGKLYLELRDFAAAEKELSRALQLGKPAAQVLPLLAQAYQRTGANQALVEVDHTNAMLSPVEQVEIGFYKVQSLAQLNKNTEAKALINELLAIDTQSVYRGLLAAFALVLEQDYQQALVKVLPLLEQAPTNKDVLGLTARLYLATDQANLAANTYAAYVQAVPDDNETRFALANLLVELQRMSEAEQHINTLLQINDQNGLLNQLKALVRAADNDFSAAYEHAQVAIQNGRADVIVRLIAGYAAYELGDYSAAENHLTSIASSLPNNHPGLRLLAASQLQNGKGIDATAALQRINNTDAQDATLFSKAGFELLQAGDTVQAQQAIARASETAEKADDLTRIGILKLSINDLDGILDLQRAVEQAPDSVSSRTTLATAYLATNQIDQATQLAEEWLQSQPKSVEALLLNADLASRANQLPAAQAFIDQAMALSNRSTQVVMAQVGLYIREQKASQALQTVEALLEQDPTYPSVSLAYFGLMQQQGKVSNALSRLAELQQNYADNAQLSARIARIQVAANDISAALTSLQNINADASAPREFWPVKGAALLQSNQSKQAQAHYDAWLALRPLDRNAAMGRLMLHNAEREYAQGLNLATDYLVRKPDPMIRMLQTHFLVLSEQYDDAQEALALIPEQALTSPFMQAVQARFALHNNNVSAASAFAKQAFTAVPSVENLRLYVAALESNQQAEQAYALINNFVASQPSSLLARMMLAERTLQTDPVLAVTQYRDALALNQNNFIALNNLAHLLLEQGQLADASQYAERAYTLRPGHIAIADTYAQILLAQGKAEEALSAYNKAKAINAENEEIYLNYIETLLVNNNKVIAGRRLADRTFNLPESQQRIQALKDSYKL